MKIHKLNNEKFTFILNSDRKLLFMDQLSVHAFVRDLHTRVVYRFTHELFMPEPRITLQKTQRFEELIAFLWSLKTYFAVLNKAQSLRLTQRSNHSSCIPLFLLQSFSFSQGAHSYWAMLMTSSYPKVPPIQSKTSFKRFQRSLLRFWQHRLQK